MQYVKKISLCVVVAAAMVVPLFAPVALAAPIDVFPADACHLSQVCAGSDNQSVTNIMKTVINILIWASGIISVLVIIVGGIQYALAAGDASKITKAKDTVLYAIIGLVVSLLAFGIVTYVVGKL